MRKVATVGSTHTSRCIAGLRRRAAKHGDDYLLVVADEMERVYQVMYNARRALLVVQKAADLGLQVKE